MASTHYDPRPKQPHVALWWILIILVGLFGVLFFTFSVTDIFTGEYVGGRPDYETQVSASGEKKDTTLGVLLGMTVACGAVPLIIAGWMFYNLTRRKNRHKAELEQWLETNILRFAAVQKGKITAEETAMQFSISVSQAKSVLESLVVKNVAELRVSDSGVLVYEIRGLNEDKERTERV